MRGVFKNAERSHNDADIFLLKKKLPSTIKPEGSSKISLWIPSGEKEGNIIVTQEERYNILSKFMMELKYPAVLRVAIPKGYPESVVSMRIGRFARSACCGSRLGLIFENKQGENLISLSHQPNNRDKEKAWQTFKPLFDEDLGIKLENSMLQGLDYGGQLLLMQNFEFGIHPRCETSAAVWNVWRNKYMPGFTHWQYDKWEKMPKAQKRTFSPGMHHSDFKKIQIKKRDQKLELLREAITLSLYPKKTLDVLGI